MIFRILNKVYDDDEHNGDVLVYVLTIKTSKTNNKASINFKII